MPLGGVCPVHQPGLDLGAVVAPGRDVGFGHREIRQRAKPFAVVERKAGGLLQRGRRETGVGTEGDACEHDVLVVIGETHDLAVGPGQGPAARDRGGPGREVGCEGCRKRHQTRSSTTGTLGTSPAWKVATEAWIWSVSKRTATSNS